MRRLGSGHSVMFFAPLEVHRRICVVVGRNPDEDVTVHDILRWTMEETCDEIQRYILHWIQQGVDHEHRMKAAHEFSQNNEDVKILKSAWCKPEAQTLEEMYGVFPVDSSSVIYDAASKIPAMRERLDLLGASLLSDTSMDEEQEREVSHEGEKERRVERPPNAVAAVHNLHQHVIDFVQTGTIPYGSPGFSPLSRHLRITNTEVHPWLPCLLMTRDFLRAVTPPNGRSTSFALSEYLRPVNWVLSSTQSGDSMYLVVLSPYEVQHLLPDIRRSTMVHLHLYTPRVTQAMKDFANLKFHCIPALPDSWTPPPLIIQSMINLWAGQLYFDSYETYLHVCAFLGVYIEESVGKGQIQSDGFIKPEDRHGPMLDLCLFEESPLRYLKELTGLRRKGMGYLTTHMGKILNARSLVAKEFL